MSLANRIKDKQIECALLLAGEAQILFVTRLKDGLEVNWSDEPGGEPEIIGKSEDGTNDHEKIHASLIHLQFIHFLLTL